MSAATIEPGGARALLDELTRRGVALRANGDRLAYDAPKGAVGDLLPEIARLKPELLALLQSASPSHRWSEQAPGAPTVTDPATAPDDVAALNLLAKYRRGGALLELETIQHAGAPWLALAVDLSGVKPEKRDHAFAQIERHAREIQSALNAEARAQAQALAHERARRQIEGAMPPALLTQWRAFSEADRHAEARALALLDAGIDPARAALS